jgi:hypothetical protein
VFERKHDDVRFGSTVPDHRARSEQLARLTRDNTLFLSVAAHNDVAEVQPLYQWFRTGVRFARGGDWAEDQLLRWLGDDRQRSSIIDLIGAADLGISDITARSEVAFEQLTTEERELVNEVVSKAERGGMTDGERREIAMRTIELANRGRRLRTEPRLRFHHGRGRAVLTFDEQSAGTQGWIGLISAALGALDDAGLLVIDEVDASLHPHLAARLINLFRDPETNQAGAQLLLTTHDATLLDEDTLSRDEIWFVEKEPDSGVTRLFPLTDFHPRKNENREGRYLAGSYGAIPVLSEHHFRQAVRAGRESDAAA